MTSPAIYDRMDTAIDNTVTPWPMEELEPETVRAHNRLLAVTPVHLSVEERTYRIDVMTASVAHHSWSLEGVLRGGGRTVRALMNRGFTRLLLGNQSLADLNQYDPSLGEALVVSAAEPWLDALERGTGVSVTLSGAVPFGTTAPAGGLCIQVTACDFPGVKGCIALTGLDSLLSLAERLTSGLPVRSHTVVGAMIRVSVALPDLGLTATERSTLRPGDVLLPSDTSRCMLRAGPNLRGTVTTDDYRNFEVERTLMKNDTQSSGPGDGDAAPPDPAQFDARISFDLGELEMSLEELGALRPGHVFTLPESGPERVRVRANGAALGWGELVAVGDRLGVRLKEIDGDVGLGDS